MLPPATAALRARFWAAMEPRGQPLIAPYPPLPGERRVEACRRPEGGVCRERQIFAGDEQIVCAALPAVRISLPVLFA